jgi:2-polyprenyl-6-methoxyphenol hydroxylase-like FAD-dependent oxidoreductase
MQDVIVIGAGPVGLTASILLSRHGVSHLLVEQQPQPTDHPQAHFISARSMEILRGPETLDDRIRKNGAPLAHWRRFVYCTGLTGLPADGSGGTLLGAVDQFDGVPNPPLSPADPVHLPQHRFVGLLREQVTADSSARFVEGWEASVRESAAGVNVTLTETKTGERSSETARYVICADGAHSRNRRELGIELTSRTGVLQHLVNVHFFSPQLAELLLDRLPAMLYFIYSPKGVGVLVAHSLAEGEFVLQVPFFPPHQPEIDFTPGRCADIIAQLAGGTFDLDIRSVRPWRMGAWTARRLVSENGRCFLVGDAAHQFPPSGGFGMNLGILEVHNLTWKLALELKQYGGRSEPTPAGDLSASYDAECRPLAERVAAAGVRNFKKTVAVARAVGLDWDVARLADWALGRIPAPGAFKRRVFDGALRLGLAQVDLLKTANIVAARRRVRLKRLFDNAHRNLRLLFPALDFGVVYASDRPADRAPAGADLPDALAYRPRLQVGGRLPHFWLHRNRLRNKQKLSSVDLPALIGSQSGGPQFIAIICGDAPGFDALEADLRHRFAPLQPVRIAGRRGEKPRGDFVLAKARPEFLPPTFVAVIRPDGHIAWLWP